MKSAIGLLGLTVGTSGLFAGAVLTTGNIALGVNDEGHLNYSGGSISTVNAGALGIAIQAPTGGYYDATAPGCLCEGWGVSASGIGGGADIAAGGVSNLTVSSFTSSATNIVSTTHLTSLPDLVVEQNYSVAVAGALFRDKVTITNTGAVALTDVRYVRVMDWDVPPTEFNEFVTVKGTATTADLEYSNDNGFSFPNPLVGASSEIVGGTTNTDFTDAGPADHGAYFRFNFGSLAAGASKTFDVFYGAAYNEADMLAALGAVSVELYSLGQSNTPDGTSLGEPYTFGWGFAGVGGDIIIPPDGAVPEPSTYGLLGAMALLGVAAFRRFRRK